MKKAFRRDSVRRLGYFRKLFIFENNKLERGKSSSMALIEKRKGGSSKIRNHGYQH